MTSQASADRALSVGGVVPFFATEPAHEDRRLLLISYHFPPSPSVGALRWEKFSHVFAERGWGLDVIMADPEEVGGLDQSRLSLLPGGVRIFAARTPDLFVERSEHLLWALFRSRSRNQREQPSSELPQPSYGRHEVLRMPLSRRPYASYRAWLDYARGARWARVAADLALRITQPGVQRLVISSGPPEMAHDAGRLVSRRTGLPFAADFRDPWSLKQRLDASVASPVWYRFASLYETLALQQTSLIVMNTEPARLAISEAYPDYASRTISVLSGYENREIRRTGGARPFTVTYSGSIYLDRDPTPVLEAASKVVRELDLTPDELRLVFVGSVSEGWRSPVELAEQAGVERYVEVLPPQDRSAVLQLLAEADVLLSLPQDSDMAIPAKLFDYMMFDAWILALAEPGSATAELLRGTGADVVEREDVEGIARVLERRYRQYRAGDGAARIVRNPRHSAQAQASELVDSLEAIAGSGRDPAGEADPGQVAISSGASTNWVWLIGAHGRGAVLHVSGPSASPHRSLRRHFETALQVRQASVDRLTSKRGADWPGIAESSQDCVLLDRTLDVLSDNAVRSGATKQIIRQAHHALCSGGWLAIETTNPIWLWNLLGSPSGDSWLHRKLPFTAIVARFGLQLGLRAARIGGPRSLSPIDGLARITGRAGFQDIRAYYIDPSFEQPEALFPALGHTAAAYEALTGDAPDGVRGLALRLGGRRIKYPGFLLLARKP